jgi:diacylglycerol kinase family enzyme
MEARTSERRQWVVEGVSVGYLALARAGYHAVRSTDAGAALTAGLRALHGFHAFPIDIESDGALRTLRASQVFVANLPFYAFGLCVAPDADPSDRALDVVVLSPRTRAGLLELLRRLHHGPAGALPHVERWRAVTLRLSTAASPVVADSTDLGRHDVAISVVPHALRIVAPPCPGTRR